MMHLLLHIVTTCESEGDAELLAAKIIDAGLAACAQIEPITSHYMWDGKRERAAEFRVGFKTLAHLQAGIEAAIKEAHSYDVPQITFAPIEASDDYADWVKASVKA